MQRHTKRDDEFSKEQRARQAPPWNPFRYSSDANEPDALAKQQLVRTLMLGLRHHQVHRQNADLQAHATLRTTATRLSAPGCEEHVAYLARVRRLALPSKPHLHTPQQRLRPEARSGRAGAGAGVATGTIAPRDP